MAKDEPINEEEPIVATELQEAPAEPEVKEESPSAQTPAAPQDEPEQSESEEQPAEEEVLEDNAQEEEPKPPSRREQLRVQELLKKYGPPPEPAPSQTPPDFRTKVDADDEVYKTLDATAQEFGKAQYEQGIERAKYYNWETLLKIDEPQVQAKFPQLDPRNKEEYHEALTNALQAKYGRFVGYSPGDAEKGVPRTVQNPDIRWLDFVESELEYAQELATHLAERTQKNIAKQAALTGTRPDGSSAKRLNLNKAPSQMSDEELKAVLAQAGM